MSFKDATFDSKGNSYPWVCKGCRPRNDKHGTNEYGDPCPYDDQPLRTAKEDPSNNLACRPAYCKACGCTYSNGCPEHTPDNQERLVKP